MLDILHGTIPIIYFRLLVERVFNTCLVPYNMPEEDRMRQLLLLYCTLDEHALK